MKKKMNNLELLAIITIILSLILTTVLATACGEMTTPDDLLSSDITNGIVNEDSINLAFDDAEDLSASDQESLPVTTSPMPEQTTDRPSPTPATGDDSGKNSDTLNSHSTNDRTVAQTPLNNSISSQNSGYGNDTSTVRPWSEWSTVPVEASSARQVETKTQYSFRNIQTTEEWGLWSDWSTTEYKQSDTRNVSTYRQFRTYVVGGVYTDIIAYDRIEFAISFYKMQGGEVVSISEPTYSECHGYDRVIIRVEYKDGWSDWEGLGMDNGYLEGLASQGITYETRTLYKYQDKTITTTVGDWSAWFDFKVESSDTREVREQTLYRYRDIG